MLQLRMSLFTEVYIYSVHKVLGAKQLTSLVISNFSIYIYTDQSFYVKKGRFERPES
jgi:hypothetical protein